MSGHTLALDDPLAAAPSRRAGSRFLARGRDPLLRPVRLEGRHDRRHGARPEGEPPSRSAARTWRCSSAVAGAGRDGARERPALSPAADLRPTSSDGCASSAKTFSNRSTTASRCSIATSGSSAGTARSRSSTASRMRRRSDAPLDDDLRRADRGDDPRRRAAGSAEGATLLPRADVDARTTPTRRLLVNVGATPLRDSATRRSRHDRHRRGHHRLACSSRNSSRSRKRWRRSGCSPPASRTK